MSSRFLLALFDSVYVVTLSVWMGSILFITWGIAPMLIPTAASEGALRIIKALYIRLYAWGAISGAIALPAYLGVPLSFPEYRGPWIAVQSLAILGGILLMFYGGNTLTPAILASLSSGVPDQAKADRLLGRLSTLNGLAVALGLTLLIAFANRPAPKTQGIVERNPGDRVSATPTPGNSRQDDVPARDPASGQETEKRRRAELR